MKRYVATISSEVDFVYVRTHFYRHAEVIGFTLSQRVIVFDAYDDVLPILRCIFGVLTIEEEES